MIYCPNCGTENEETAGYCKSCGAALTGKNGFAKEGGSYTDSMAPAPVTPVRRKVSVKGIVGMVLGLNGLSCATITPIYSIGALAAKGARGSYGYREEAAALAVLTLVFVLIGVVLGIIGLILSARGAAEGGAPANHGICKCGRITSLITIIICGIALLPVLIALVR